MRRIFIIISLAFLPAVLWSLGLGPVSVKSKLNHPLQAEIPILYGDKISLSDIKVSLAPLQAYRAAGMNEPVNLPGLVFTVARNAAGDPYIQINTAEPVNTPILSFLLRVSWQNGELFRKYTLLLDPPILISGTVNRASVKQGSVGKGSQRESASLINQSKRLPLQAGRQTFATPVSQAEHTYGPVGAGEDLFSIAKKLRPEPSVSVGQTMLALFNKNPEAFKAGNINGLRTGAHLSIPSVAEIQQTDAVSAEKFISSQNELWRQGSTQSGEMVSKAASIIPPVPESSAFSRRGSPPALQMSSVPELESDILEPQADKEASGQTDSQQGVKASLSQPESEFQQKLALALAAVESLEKEKQFLQMRLNDLQSQNEQIQQQLKQREQAFVNLQAQLALQKKASGDKNDLRPKQVGAKEKLERQFSQGYQLAPGMLNRIPLLDLLVLILFLLLSGIIFRLFLKIKKLQELHLLTESAASEIPQQADPRADVGSSESAPVVQHHVILSETRGEADAVPSVNADIIEQTQVSADTETTLEEVSKGISQEIVATKIEENATFAENVQPRVDSPTEEPTKENESHVIDFDPAFNADTHYAIKKDNKDSEPAIEYSLEDLQSTLTSDEKNETSKAAEPGNLKEKLDLAQAYLDMKDYSSARELLEEVLTEGSGQEIETAKILMERINAK